MSRPGRPPLRALPGPTAEDEADGATSRPVDVVGPNEAFRRARRRVVDDRVRAIASAVRDSHQVGLGPAVTAVLHGLGGTAHEVARALADAGARGWPGDADMDPLCRWLARQIPAVNVWLGDDHLRVWTPQDVAQVRLPEPVAAYLEAALTGAYPYLRLSFTPPTVSVPHVDMGGGPEPPWWPKDVSVAAVADPTALAGQRLSVAAAHDAPPTGQVPAGEGDTGRDLVHEAYVDAVVYALQLRGVSATACWPGPAGVCAEEAAQRQATVVLPPQVWEDRLPEHSQVLLLWSEQRGWRLAPMRGWDVDTAAVQFWWDSLDRPVLPDPQRLAEWVAAVLRYGLDFGPQPGAGVAAGTEPSWRVPGVHDPSFEDALDGYQRHIGHTLAREDRAASTVIIPAVTGRGESLTAATAARARQVLREAAAQT